VPLAEHDAEVLGVPGEEHLGLVSSHCTLLEGGWSWSACVRSWSTCLPCPRGPFRRGACLRDSW
jgi:hypothetical protein